MNDRRQSSFNTAGPHGFERPPNRLMEQVCEALQADDRVDVSRIDVEMRPESDEQLAIRGENHR